MKNKEVTGMHLKKHIVFLIIVILYFITSGLYYLQVLLHICSFCRCAHLIPVSRKTVFSFVHWLPIAW